ncbi:hypothetical protein NQ314_011096 [Rhamnusium bicolor]|uniref:Uncharacterized protein n=1 Tax=Rhamnusium bicolor TaxID=1586634 RepID=A0AAV8XLS2_9CUCU|nr:hypothetical protein NQ314_011096 [Rhamnusium bicolor]
MSRSDLRSLKKLNFIFFMIFFQITTFLSAPNQIIDMIRVGRPDGLDTTSLAACIIGGAALPERLMRVLRDLLPGTFVFMGYGQTEVTGIMTLFSIKQVKHTLSLHYKPESVGIPLAGYCCKVVDPETEKPCGPNESGELRVKSRLVMNGYYGRDSSETFDAEGWLKTGDTVYYDKDHCFFIVDRIKEMLKYKSWHVAPAMVEKVLIDHPAVQKAVVFGIPHEEDGDHPAAVIILNADYKNKVTPEDIEHFIAQRAPDRMKLRGGVTFIEKIPLTPSGKVKRRDIRDMVLKGLI